MPYWKRCTLSVQQRFTPNVILSDHRCVHRRLMWRWGRKSKMLLSLPPQILNPHWMNCAITSSTTSHPWRCAAQTRGQSWSLSVKLFSISLPTVPPPIKKDIQTYLYPSRKMQTIHSTTECLKRREPQESTNSFWCYTVNKWEKNTKSVTLVIPTVVFSSSSIDLMDIWPLC